MMESLEARPDLTVILDSSGSPGSRLQARFLGHTGDVMKIQATVALGQGVLVSVAGQVDTGTGVAPGAGAVSRALVQNRGHRQVSRRAGHGDSAR